jgi:hypothetical protein
MNEPKPYVFVASYDVASPDTEISELHKRLRTWGAIEVMRNVWVGKVDPQTLETRPEDLKRSLCEGLDSEKDRLLVFSVEGLVGMQGFGPGVQDRLESLRVPRRI